MRVVLIVLGLAFAAAAIYVLGAVIAGDMSPYLGLAWSRRAESTVAFIGLPAAISVFFFRWAWNMRRGYDGR
jgi:hypothetical protein